jgi:hypothetical protein
VHTAAQVPAQFRLQFVDGFSHVAKTGFEVGRGQTGGAVHLSPAIPAGIAERLQHLASTVFTHGFVDAMRPTLVLPIGILLLAAASCLSLRRAGHASRSTSAASEMATSVA